MNALLPRIGQEIVQGQRVLKPWYDWFNQLTVTLTSGDTDLAAIRAAIAELQAAQTLLESQITLLQTQVDQFAGDIAILQAQVAAIEALLVFVTYSTGSADGDKITRTRPDGVLDPTLTLTSINTVTRDIFIPEDINLLYSSTIGLDGDYEIDGDGYLEDFAVGEAPEVFILDDESDPDPVVTYDSIVFRPTGVPDQYTMEILP